MTIFNEFFRELREDEKPPLTYHCNQCGRDNDFVNQCGCDPHNMPTRPQKESITEEVQFKVGDVIERPDKPSLGKVVVVKVTEYGYVVKYRPNGVDPDPMMLHSTSARNWTLAKP